MNTKVTYSIIGIIGIALIAGLLVMKQGGTAQSPATVTTASGVGASSNPQDIVPGTYPNQINNTATVSGLTLVSGKVENNTDDKGKITNDHLEILLKNTSTQDMSTLEVYYTITDLTTGKSEAYYKKLEGLVLKGGESKPVHFDGVTGDGHFSVNTNSLYYTSKNKLQFDVQASASGFKIAHIQLTKDAGGAELKD